MIPIYLDQDDTSGQPFYGLINARLQQFLLNISPAGAVLTAGGSIITVPAAGLNEPGLTIQFVAGSGSGGLTIKDSLGNFIFGVGSTGGAKVSGDLIQASADFVHAIALDGTSIPASIDMQVVSGTTNKRFWFTNGNPNTAGSITSTGKIQVGDLCYDYANFILWVCTATGGVGTWTKYAVQTIVPGTGISVNNADPGNPIVSATGGSGGAVQLISSQVLAVAAASITFSSIPQTFNHLQLMVEGRSAAAQATDAWCVFVNGIVSGYDRQANEAGANVNGATNTPANASQWNGNLIVGATGGDMPGATGTAGVVGNLELKIPNYAAATFQKAGRWMSGYVDGVLSNNAITDQVVSVRSNAAVSTLSIRAASTSNLAAGTSAYLYGIT